MFNIRMSNASSVPIKTTKGVSTIRTPFVGIITCSIYCLIILIGSKPSMRTKYTPEALFEISIFKLSSSVK